MTVIAPVIARLRKKLSARPAAALPQGGAPGDLLDHERLAELAAQAAPAYAVAEPFPHAVLDGFIGPGLARRLAAEFPARDDAAAWLDYNGNDAQGKPVQVNKYHISDEHRLGPLTQRLLYELKGPRFLGILGRLTGIPELIPDAHNHGGGIHMSCRGAMLKIHADFNRHPTWQLDRRLNLLLYLNEDWKASYGGDLELWDAQMRECVRKIAPVAGRCVVFSTSSTSYHGHPDPIDCPEHVARKSVALYYYTNRDGAAEVATHSTLWQPRPGSAD